MASDHRAAATAHPGKSVVLLDSIVDGLGGTAISATKFDYGSGTAGNIGARHHSGIVFLRKLLMQAK